MNAEILKLAKECGLADEDGDCYHPIRAELESFYRAAYNAGLEAAAKVCDGEVCGSQGFAGPTCCVLPPAHIGEHSYGVPMAMTQRECAAAIRSLKEKP